MSVHLEIYRGKPGHYGSIARRVDVAMAQQAQPCRGGECDDQGRCARHTRFSADRFARLQDRWARLEEAQVQA